MRILQWRPRESRTSRAAGPQIRFPSIGDFAGRARYLPGDTGGLTPTMRSAVGQVIELEFAGMAPSGPLSGQSLYRETSESSLLGSAVVPEQDLDFLDHQESQ